MATTFVLAWQEDKRLLTTAWPDVDLASVPHQVAIKAASAAVATEASIYDVGPSSGEST